MISPHPLVRQRQSFAVVRKRYSRASGAPFPVSRDSPPKRSAKDVQNSYGADGVQGFCASPGKIIYILILVKYLVVARKRMESVA